MPVFSWKEITSAISVLIRSSYPAGSSLAGAQVGARGAEFIGLREGADGGRRQQGKPEVGTLGCRSLPVRLGAAAVGVRDGGGPGLHGRVVGDGGVGAGGEVRPIGGDLGGDGVGALGQSLGQSGDLHRLLPGEGEPAEDLGIDVRLGRRVEGDVQEGAGGGDVDPAA